MVMKVGVPKETKTRESRVAMTPAGVRELTRHGHEVLVETHAGEGSGINDQAYVEAGGRVGPLAADAWAAGMGGKGEGPQGGGLGGFGGDLILCTVLHLAAGAWLTREM